MIQPPPISRSARAWATLVLLAALLHPVSPPAFAAEDSPVAASLVKTNQTDPTDPTKPTDRSDPSDRSNRSDPSDQPSSSSSRRSSRRSSNGPDRPSRRADRSPEPSGSSTNTAGATGSDFASFKIISERNIFNPNRGRSNGRADREARKPTQVDTVHLVGTMSYAKGDFAFFDGSSSQFRKTLKCGDSIAGYTVKAISANAVKLEAGEKPLEMQVGSQLRREDEGEWKFIARSDAPPVASSSLSSNSSGTDGDRSSASSDTSGAANDILMRLMKKREQEK